VSDGLVPMGLLTTVVLNATVGRARLSSFTNPNVPMDTSP
jgi:hypothetical protein